jgi:hypothetical protein
LVIVNVNDGVWPERIWPKSTVKGDVVPVIVTALVAVALSWSWAGC